MAPECTALKDMEFESVKLDYMQLKPVVLGLEHPYRQAWRQT